MLNHNARAAKIYATHAKKMNIHQEKNFKENLIPFAIIVQVNHRIAQVITVLQTKKCPFKREKHQRHSNEIQSIGSRSLQ